MTFRGIRAAHASSEAGLDAVALLRQQIRQSHSHLDACAATWLHPPPSSSAWSRPVGLYLHAVCVEDITIQSVLRNHAPLFTSFSPNLGVAADPAALREYARAVYAATEAYVAELTPAGVCQAVDLYRLGLGRQTVGWVIKRFVIAELAHICSQISRATAHRQRLPQASRGSRRNGARCVRLGKAERQ
ncbi:MAG: hypothetical protein M3069_11525 [Chloroflexota bacterium]|nr:hypothetical protein [Chloroflexota bacterium]